MTSIVKRLSLLAAALAAAVVFVLPSAVIQADEFNLLTYITVSQPVQVPGAVLQPNTKYVLRRLDSTSGLNHVVRVLNEDQSQVIATFYAVSDYRLEPTGDTVLTFMETAPGYPRPVRSWFYPGRVDGMEFMYSSKERAEIASHAPGSMKAEVQTASVTNETAPAPATDITPAPAMDETAAAVTPDNTSVMPENTDNGENAQAAASQEATPAIDQAPANQEAAPAMASTSDTDTGRELPHTAGELPLLGLIGLASLGLRQALRRF